jgi:hypothetical protein
MNLVILNRNSDAQLIRAYSMKIFWFHLRKLVFLGGKFYVIKNYESRLGICFDDNFGEPEEISIEFYSKNGLIKSLNQILVPLNSLIFDNDFF